MVIFISMSSIVFYIERKRESNIHTNSYITFSFKIFLIKIIYEEQEYKHRIKPSTHRQPIKYRLV